jgi:hypothetical protein
VWVLYDLKILFCRVRTRSNPCQRRRREKIAKEWPSIFHNRCRNGGCARFPSLEKIHEKIATPDLSKGWEKGFNGRGKTDMDFGDV